MCRRIFGAYGLRLNLETLCHSGGRQAVILYGPHTHLQLGICGCIQFEAQSSV